jgi:hypothetical protein
MRSTVTKLWTALTAALIVCVATSASAQAPAAEDTRTQYPSFLTNSYFSFNIGSIGYLFTGRQLEPGFEAESITKPRPAVRVDFFGHRFNKHLLAQVTYMRPARFVTYHNINGDKDRHQTSMAYAGFTLAADMPVTERVAAYLEAGIGVTSRTGFEIDGVMALPRAHYAAGLVGGGLAVHMRPTMDLMLGATYSPGRQSFRQPSTRLYTAGIRYEMQPLPEARVIEARNGGFAFPANIVRLGVTSNALGYGVNNFFSRKVPIFWGGHVETRVGGTLDYQRNTFHTKKVFAFDIGASISYWRTDANRDVFRTMSVYPLFRFFMARTESTDVYFGYSLAGPSFINRPLIDGEDTGEHFTFQDFMAVGALLGKARRINAEIGIKHFSNGNIFTRNASVKIPLTFSLGMTF